MLRVSFDSYGQREDLDTPLESGWMDGEMKRWKEGGKELGEKRSKVEVQSIQTLRPDFRRFVSTLDHHSSQSLCILRPSKLKDWG